MTIKLLRYIRLSLFVFLSASVVMAQDTDQPHEGGLTGTGIMGVLNNAGIIKVGDLSVTLPTNLSVQTPLGSTQMDRLSSGDMVAIQLGGTSPEFSVLDAQQIIQLIGPIALQNNETITVLGTTVHRTNTMIETDARVGDWVAVSGYWREDGVVATRIVMVPPQDTTHIQGTYQPISVGVGLIGDTRINGLFPMPVSQGDVIQVSGAFADGVFEMKESEVRNLGQSVRTFLAQGYQSTPDSAGFYTVLGTGISSITERPEMVNSRELVIVCSVEQELTTDLVFAPDDTSLCQALPN